MAKGIGYLTYSLGGGLLKAASWAAGVVESLLGPYLIDAVTYQEWMPMLGPSLGPFPYGSNLYIAYQDSVDVLEFTIFKSTDAGATWTPIQTMPAGTSYTFLVRAGSTSHLRLVSIATGPVYSLYDFDMATDTLTLVDATLAVSPVWLHYNHVTEEDIVFSKGGLWGGELWITRFKSGAWQAAQKIRGVAAVFPGQTWREEAVTDNDGITYIFSVPNYLAPFVMNCQLLLADGSLGTEFASIHIFGVANTNQLARPAIINDTVVLPLYDTGYWLVGTGLSALVFSTIESSTPGIYTNVSVNNAYGLPGTDGRLWWWESYYPVADMALSSVYDGTTRGATETVIDEYANPSIPGVDPGDQMLMYQSPPVLLSANKWGFCFSMYMEPPPGALFPHYYWEWTKGTAAAMKGVARLG